MFTGSSWNRRATTFATWPAERINHNEASIARLTRTASATTTSGRCSVDGPRPRLQIHAVLHIRLHLGVEPDHLDPPTSVTDAMRTCSAHLYVLHCHCIHDVRLTNGVSAGPRMYLDAETHHACVLAQRPEGNAIAAATSDPLCEDVRRVLYFS